MRLIGQALACAVCIAACAAAAAAQPVKIAATGPTATFAPLFMAADKGYFHDEGIEAQILYMGGGTSIPAMIGGSIDYSAAAASSMAAIMKGAKLKVILVGQATVDFQIWSFDPKVTTFDALKGHSLAVVSRGGSEEIATLMYLKANNYPRDFVGFSAIQGPARIAAVVGGTGGYGVLLPNDIPVLAEKGELAKGKMLLDFTKWVQLSAGGLVTSDKEIAEHRDRVLRVIEAVRKGALYVKAFPDSAVELLQKRNPDSPHQALVNEMKASYPNLNWSGTISLESQRRELSARGDILSLASSQIPTPAAAYDFSFVTEADRDIAASGWTPSR
ncbi:MAG TPA: ABC transporter substrate-binding protein [Stellaceae bacterium]|nr:ABC transporter substrate-binding protein [Stellaceae bacterium]